MPSHARPSASKPLKPEDDWTRVKDPREKKRIQNRVAQRTYRHRMKARLGELQARLEQHEGPQPVSTATTGNETHAPLPGMGQQTFPSPSPSEQQPKALPRLDTNVYQFSVEEYVPQLPASNGPGQLDTPSRSHSLPPNYGLLSPPSQSDASSAMTPDAVACSNLNGQYADLSALPVLDDLNSIPSVSGAQSLAPTSASSPPQVNDASNAIVDPSAQNAMQFFNSHLNPLPPTSVVDASQTFGSSPSCASQTPMADNASQAGSDWGAWEGAGFQDEALRMMESVIKVENSTARHDLIAKMAPQIEGSDDSGIYNPEILTQMKQSMQEDLPNTWACTQAMAADYGAAWQSDRSNIALASMMLMSFAGRISNEKLLCLVGGCL